MSVGPASAGTGRSGLATDYAGPAIVAKHESCIGWTGSQVTSSGLDEAAGGTAWGWHNPPNYSPPNGGHRYHVYSWITGTWQGKSVYQAIANSPEFTAP